VVPIAFESKPEPPTLADNPQRGLDGQAPPEEGDSKTTAQRSERRRGEISYRRVPTGREVLEVFQDAGVHPKAADDLHTTAARDVACHSDRSRPGVGDEMLKLAGEPGSHHLLCRQQRQDSEENDAAPGEDAERCHEKASAHRLTFIDDDRSGKAVLGISVIAVDEAHERLQNIAGTEIGMPPLYLARITRSRS
jgi:hypothetical protein